MLFIFYFGVSYLLSLFRQTIEKKFKLKNIEFTIKEVSKEYIVAYTIWDCAKVLLEFLGKNFNNEDFKKKIHLSQESRILELGSGTGITGLTISEFLPKKIVLTDMQKYIQFLQNNINLNKDVLPKQTEFICTALQWGKQNEEEIAKLIQDHGPFDLIIGSDLVQNDDSVELLFQTLDAIKKFQGEVIFVLCYQPRGFFGSFFVENYKENWDFEMIYHKENQGETIWSDINIIIIKNKNQQLSQSSGKK